MLLTRQQLQQHKICMRNNQQHICKEADSKTRTTQSNSHTHTHIHSHCRRLKRAKPKRSAKAIKKHLKQLAWNLSIVRCLPAWMAWLDKNKSKNKKHNIRKFDKSKSVKLSHKTLAATTSSFKVYLLGAVCCIYVSVWECVCLCAERRKSKVCNFSIGQAVLPAKFEGR